MDSQWGIPPTTPPSLGRPPLGGDDVALRVQQEGGVTGVVPDGAAFLAGEVSANRSVTTRRRRTPLGKPSTA